MAEYKVTIREASKELTAKQRIRIKDTTNAVSLDEITMQGDFILSPDFYAVLDIVNEKAKADQSKEYTKYVICDKGGTLYHTGSESFMSSLVSIMEEMDELAPDEEYTVTVSRRDSKNYKGKSFITCSLND